MRFLNDFDELFIRDPLTTYPFFCPACSSIHSFIRSLIYCTWCKDAIVVEEKQSFLTYSVPNRSIFRLLHQTSLLSAQTFKENQ